MTNTDTEKMLETIDNEITDAIQGKLEILHEELWDDVIAHYTAYISEEIMERIADIIREKIGNDGQLNNMVRQMMSANTVSNIDSALSSINLRIKSIEKVNNEYIIKAI